MTCTRECSRFKSAKTMMYFMFSSWDCGSGGYKLWFMKLTLSGLKETPVSQIYQTNHSSMVYFYLCIKWIWSHSVILAANIATNRFYCHFWWSLQIQTCMMRIEINCLKMLRANYFECYACLDLDSNLEIMKSHAAAVLWLLLCLRLTIKHLWPHILRVKSVKE